jgi:hypothetical protein
MRREDYLLDPELQMLLARGRLIRRLPHAVRARALARATFAAGAAVARPSIAAPARALLVVLAALVCLAVTLAGAFAVLRYR